MLQQSIFFFTGGNDCAAVRCIYMFTNLTQTACRALIGSPPLITRELPVD